MQNVIEKYHHQMIFHGVENSVEERKVNLPPEHHHLRSSNCIYQDANMRALTAVC